MNQWTVMVYMAGDNNLSLEMAQSIESIKKVTEQNANIKLYVYFDSFSRNVPTLYCDFSDFKDGIQYYRSSLIPDKVMLVENEFNENSASIENIINFVNWCVKKDVILDESGNILEDQREKRNYAFIFSGHTFSFLDWGLYKDENADSYMTLSKLRWMFSRITANKTTLDAWAQEDERISIKKNNKEWSEEYKKSRTTEILGKKLALIGFDSCEMSTIEVASQFSEIAETMVASEGSVPNAGWNYTQILLGKLKGKATSSPTDIAVSIVDEFIQQQSKFALADISVDMSAWKLSEVSNLNTAVEQLARSLLECLINPQTAAYNQILRILSHAHWQCQTYLLEQLVDLGDLCQLIAKEIDLLRSELLPEHLFQLLAVGEACREVIARIKNCILITGFSGSDFQYSNGVSIFFPWSYACYQTAEKDYIELSFIKTQAGQKWNEFLVKFLKDSTLRKSRQLSPVNQEGKILLSEESKQIVFNSYVFNDDAPLPPQESTPTDASVNPALKVGTKRPPNEFRRPPNEFRSASSMNIFLSRFMKLKNCETNWNRAGFSSTQVSFQAEEDDKIEPSAAGTSVPTVSPLLSGPRINIPRSTPILKELDKFLFTLAQIRELNPNDPRIEEIRQRIKENFASFNNPSKIDILNGLVNLNEFKEL